MDKIYCFEPYTWAFKAKWCIDKNWFRVLKWSICSSHVANSAEKFRHVTERRLLLEKEWVLRKENNHFVFSKDYVFPSSSAAATLVSWRTTNWKLVWKIK